MWVSSVTVGLGSQADEDKQTLKIARECYGIKLSYPCFYELLKKWPLTGGVKDATKANLHQKLVSDRGLLAINKELLSIL